MTSPLQQSLDAALRRGFLERMAQYDQAAGMGKTALELGTVLRAAEHGTPSRTPGQLSGLLGRAAQRQESAAARFHSLPSGDPRKALALKRLQDNAGLSTMTGAVQDQLGSAMEKARAAIPAPAPQGLMSEAHQAMHPDDLELTMKMHNRLMAGSPMARSATLPAEPLRAAGTKADLPHSLPRVANG